MRRNRGAAGIDQLTITDVEHYEVTRLLDEPAADLHDGSYRPLAARRSSSRRPVAWSRRPLSIPAVRDRVVQAAARIVLEPIFEADMLECSFGFRPGRSTYDALQVLIMRPGTASDGSSRRTSLAVWRHRHTAPR
ncbi:MAG: hypothetical protein M3406_01615 [Chloroflexota bacterium]|nr:hypothetical protein [Chloroflexota bacterium]